jgi:hypothetical protein
MNVVLIFLVILTFLIIIGILIDKSNIFASPEPISKNKQFNVQKQQQQLQTNAFLPYPTWSQPEPFSVNGACNAYTFLGGSFTPGVPSYSDLNNEVKNNLIQQSVPNFVCIDPDQIFASTISHECVNPQGLSAGSGCILTVPTCSSDGFYRQAGQFATPGTIEGDNTIGCSGSSGVEYSREYYAPCNPSSLINNIPNTNYCIGNIGLIIPEFIPQPSYTADENTCIAGMWPLGLNNNIYTIASQSCDLSDSTQIFRIIRYSLDANNNLQLDNTGNLASFVHRYTGYYLSPDFGSNIVNNNGTTGYIFDQPNVQYQQITDNTGNKFNNYVNLVLINPAYDSVRNGVYWLLQNQTPDPAINPQLLNFNSYTGKGILVNQYNYDTQYAPNNVNDTNHPPTVPSYFIEATIKTCEANPSNIGCTGTIPSIADLEGVTGSVNSCYFGITNPSIGGVSLNTFIENVPFPEAPQQIVYIPDLNLLPNFSTANPSISWTYLINNYSINLYTDSNSNLTPILTPYRQNRKTTLSYNCLSDPDNINSTNPSAYNYFTQLTSFSTSPNKIPYVFQKSNGTYEDSQFVNYSSYIQQIQTPVSQNYDFSGSQYANSSNPFNI